jgi:hypothetical protein
VATEEKRRVSLGNKVIKTRKKMPCFLKKSIVPNSIFERSIKSEVATNKRKKIAIPLITRVFIVYPKIYTQWEIIILTNFLAIIL